MSTLKDLAAVVRACSKNIAIVGHGELAEAAARLEQIDAAWKAVRNPKPAVLYLDDNDCPICVALRRAIEGTDHA